MHLQKYLAVAACFAGVAASAVAAGAGAGPSRSISAPPASAARLTAWKPQAWRLPGAPLAAAPAVQVSIDPVTGMYEMPAPSENGGALVIRDDSPVQVDVLANGARRAHLDDRFAEFAVVRLGADGRPHWSCVHSQGTALQYVTHPVPADRQPAPGTVWEEK